MKKMKEYKIYMLVILLLGITACEDSILNLESLTAPVNTSFYSNEEELELALTGVYNSLRFVGQPGSNSFPVQIHMDNSASDIAVSRAIELAGTYTTGQGNQSSTTTGFQQSYTHWYRGIGRANALLQYMEKAKDVVPENRYNEIRAQALVLRAYYYSYLMEFFGDVPYIDKVLNSSLEGLVPRTKKAEITDKLLVQLEEAAALLPDKWPPAFRGKITKGVALTLRARIVLYDKRYAEAAKSAKAVIDREGEYGYSLHPDYQQLFQKAGQTSSEIMLICPFKDQEGFRMDTPILQGSRNLGSFCTGVPTQSLVDSYEAIDGKPIDESAVYNPKDPWNNRDPRLKASIITPGTVWAGIIFESHPDSLQYRLANGQIAGANNDSRGVIWAASFCGYLWRKYTPEEEQTIKQTFSDINFTLMRYAETLLIYAEAKIELGEIDGTVLNAINRIRARAYGVDVANPAAYPAITTTDQAELRKVLRRERKVELANEGFRLFDIRRWRIAEKVMPVKIYGRVHNLAEATGIPSIDDDCFVSYEGIESEYDFNPDARFPNAQNRRFDKNRDYLSPIPQQEIDTYMSLGATLEQNPGY